MIKLFIFKEEENELITLKSYWVKDAARALTRLGVDYADFYDEDTLKEGFIMKNSDNKWIYRVGVGQVSYVSNDKPVIY